MPFDWRSLVSGKGRVNRTVFWNVQLLLAVFQTCVRATGLLFDVIPIILMVTLLLVASAVVAVCNTIKRVHDLGRSGWWLMVPMILSLLIVGGAAAIWGRGSTAALSTESLVEFVLLIVILAIGLLPGDPLPNRFGPAPEAKAAAAGS